jgi:predicted amidohydrolase
MASFPTVRVAAIQATPVILDADACVAKVERLLHEVADAGVELAVLPECFVPQPHLNHQTGGDIRDRIRYRS